ncbi:Uncharacterized protein FKW44_013880, partial [Caligus rogercresseyi]
SLAFTFEELTDKIKEKFNTDFDEIFDYLEDTYIGRYGRNASRSRNFAINLWNIFNQTDEGLPRTNNNVERWHRRFSSQVASCHPILSKFLEFLKNEENLIRIDIIQQLAGHPPPLQRRQYRDCNQRILTILKDYENREIVDYL